MTVKIHKGDYVVELEDYEQYDEAEVEKLIDDTLVFLKHKEAKEHEDIYEPYLVHKDGRKVEKGDEVVDFRGDKAIVTGWEAPKYQGKSGRVYVEEVMKDGSKFSAGYYPEVYDLKWKGLSWQKEEVEDIKIEDK